MTYRFEKKSAKPKGKMRVITNKETAIIITPLTLRDDMNFLPKKIFLKCYIK
jgi:hypothetical protein